MTDSTLTAEDTHYIDAALGALICERNDHHGPLCDGCYAMAAFLRENGYGRLDAARASDTALREAVEAIPLGTVPKPGLSSVAGWNRYDTDDEHVLHLFEWHETGKGQSWHIRVALASPEEPR